MQQFINNLKCLKYMNRSYVLKKCSSASLYLTKQSHRLYSGWYYYFQNEVVSLKLEYRSIQCAGRTI